MVTATPPRSRALWATWFLTVTVAELVGFSAPLLAGALTADAGPGVAVPALLVAGAVEGAVLGSGQAAVLRRALPELPGRRWVVATAVAAVFCYALGLLPSTSAGVWAAWPVALTFVIAVALGLLLLGAIGLAQWWVLRRHVPRAAWWIPATGVAWLAALAAFLAIAVPLWQPGQPTMLVVGIGLVAGLVVAAVVAAITGWALVRLLQPGDPAHRGRAPRPV